MKKRNAYLAVALLAAHACAVAQWQWIDKDGGKVFSDRAPPPDVLDKNIVKRPNAPPVAASSANGGAVADASGKPGDTTQSAAPLPSKPRSQDKELEARKKQLAEAEAAKQKAEQDKQQKAKAENCKLARQNKATLDSGVRLAHTNAAGETQAMDDTARAAESKRVQAIIDTQCSAN